MRSEIEFYQTKHFIKFQTRRIGPVGETFRESPQPVPARSKDVLKLRRQLRWCGSVGKLFMKNH